MNRQSHFFMFFSGQSRFSHAASPASFHWETPLSNPASCCNGAWRVKERVSPASPTGAALRRDAGDEIGGGLLDWAVVPGGKGIGLGVRARASDHDKAGDEQRPDK
jgi:hypothetical protein